MQIEQVQAPKIDLRNCGSITGVTPIQIVNEMSAEEFEQFVCEWLFVCDIPDFSAAYRLGGTGDKGRDVIVKKHSGAMDIYQCKHYSTALSFCSLLPELNKLLYYTWKEDYPTPEHYYLVAQSGLSPSLHDLMMDKEKLREKILSEWKKESKIVLTTETSYDVTPSIESYCNDFDFSIIEYIPVEQIIDTHLNSKYGRIRFNLAADADIEEIMIPDCPDSNEEQYTNQLLLAYSYRPGIPEGTVYSYSDLDESLRKHFSEQRRHYYNALSVERTSKELFLGDEFSKVKEEIACGVEEIALTESNPFRRMTRTLEQSVTVDTGQCPLDYQMHWISGGVKKGTCHILVNDGKLKWV